MALPQQKFREIVFHLLYSHDFSEVDEEDMTAFMMHEFAVTKKTLRSAHERLRQIVDKRDEIDNLIKGASVSYEFDRIPRIERNILRLGVFEMLHDASIPAKVAISEAIRLSRKFATAEGSSFVNAILDGLYQKASLAMPSITNKAQEVPCLSSPDLKKGNL